ncbi:MAG: Rieske (2Fe-2S) protein [Anaerolineae bacterium]|nr:Rieske (2Fe-2S) protein [Anaerolineae bacterium]
MNRREFLKTPLEPEDPAKSQPVRPIVTTPEAGYPREYGRHTSVLVESARAWLCRDELGFYAVDALCPHLGGMVRPAVQGFVCPCHRSIFADNGEPLSGPATRQLRYFRVDLGDDGRLVIERGQTVSPDDRFFA